MALNPKQQRFVSEYMVDMNASRAAIRAGYSANGAGQAAHKLLKNAEIQSAISEAQTKIAEKYNVTVERIVREYAKIAFCDPRKFYDESGNLIPIPELGDDEAAALASFEQEKRTIIGQEDETSQEIITKKLKFWDKTKSLEALGRHLGLFKDKIEHTGRVVFVDEAAQVTQGVSEKAQAGQEIFHDE